MSNIGCNTMSHSLMLEYHTIPIEGLLRLIGNTNSQPSACPKAGVGVLEVWVTKAILTQHHVPYPADGESNA